MKTKEITQEILKEYLFYDPITGYFTWIKQSARNIFPGFRAGTLQQTVWGKTYIKIKLLHVQYFSHRLAFIYMTGLDTDLQVDHINGDGTDNRWVNLRLVTHQDNGKNQKKHSNNTSGISGINFDRYWNKWLVRISINQKVKNLGYYDNLFDAACVRKSAELKHSYHSNHGSNRSL